MYLWRIFWRSLEKWRFWGLVMDMIFRKVVFGFSIVMSLVVSLGYRRGFIEEYVVEREFGLVRIL